MKSVDVIASSPLVRARQTAAIAQRRSFKRAPLATWPELEEAEFPALKSRLQTSAARRILLVGHEPGLSRFTSRLLTGTENGFDVAWKKAAV